MLYFFEARHKGQPGSEGIYLQWELDGKFEFFLNKPESYQIHMY